MKTCYYIAFAFAIVVVLAKGTIGNDTGCLGVELLSKDHFANFSSLRENGSRDVSQPGSKLKCSCSNSGSPQKMQWLGPDKMALATKGVVRVRQRNNADNSRTLVLILTGVINCTYAGVYTCQLENNIDFEVPYLIFPKKGNCSPQNVTIDVVPDKPGTGNSSVVLKCWSQSSAIDLLQYLWMVNGENQTNITNCLQVNVTQSTTVTCTVSNIFGSTSVSINIPVQDMPVALPLQPTNLTSSYANSTSITLTWKYPDSDHKMSYQINISSFTIVYNEEEVETNSADETHTLHGLDPSTSYIISVTAENSGNKGKSSDWIVANTTGKIEGLPEVMNLQHQDITVYNSTNIHQPLTWHSLTSNHQAVTNYSIRYSLSVQECSQQDGAFEEVTSTTNSQTLVLPVPMSETQYTVCVAAVGNETGTGVYSKLQINYTEPDAPLLRAIDVQSCKKVIVAWDAPHDKGGLPVQGYQLHYYSDSTQEPVVLNIRGNTTEKELDNLLPGTEYTFVIKATTSIATGNNDTLSNSTHFRGSADEILIATQDKSRMINTTSKNGTTFICWINKTKDQYENYTVNETTTVEGLQPDTLYSIDCVEINSNGEYQCRELNTTVLTGLPPPTNFTIGSVSLNKVNPRVLQTVQWDFLTSEHQMVEQYKVKYGTDSEFEMSNMRRQNNQLKEFRIVFTIPQEPITYFVWVAGRGSSTGVGEYSKALEIKYTAPDQPSEINTTNLTCNAIQLTWEQPDNNGGLPIQGYHLSCSNVTATGNDSTYTTETSREWLDRLPNTLYNVCIRANNSILNQTCQPYSITTSPRDDVGMTAVRFSNTAIRVNIASSQTYTCSAREKTKQMYLHINTSTEGIGLFEGLTQNTEYSINCTGVKNACEVANTTATTIIGVPGAPTIGAANPATTCQSIQISWTPPNNTGGDEIQLYTVTYYSGAVETKHRNTTSVNGMSITLNGLAPNTEYTVLVNASNSEQTGEAANITVRTDNRGPGNIMVMEASISATFVQLQHPLGSAVNYKCNILGNIKDQFNIPDKGHTLSGLSADTPYTVNCVAYKDKLEYCLEANETFQTLPGRVNKVQLENMGMVTMDGQNRKVQQTISWKRPKNHSSTLNYTIKYGRASEVRSPNDSSARETTVTGTITTTTLNLLLPDIDKVPYKIWVAARSSAGLGEYSKQLTINYTAPTQPEDVTVVPLSCNSVNITWKPPVNPGDLTLTQYTIQYHGPTINMTTGADSTFIKVNNLIPGEMYTAQVKATNGFKDSRLSSAATNTTQMRDRANITTFNVTSTRIILKRVNSSGKFECHVGSKNMPVTLESNSYQQVSGLTPDTDYNIGCVGTGTNTKCLEQNATVRTAPGKVESIITTGMGMVMNPTIHQTISWERPENHSSQLTYTVKYGIKERINREKNTVHNINGTTTTLTFRVLEQSKTIMLPLSYNVWVAAVSAAGEGPISKKTAVTYAAPDAPTGLTFGEITCNALLLRWTEPGSTGGLPITGYQIEYLENSNATMPVAGNMTSATIVNLHPNTTYKIKIRAQNYLGPGLFSEEKQRTTMKRNTTTSIQVQATSSTSVKLSRTDGGKQYECFLNNSMSTVVKLTTSTSTATVAGLLADTINSISCIEVDANDKYQCMEYNTTVHTENFGKAKSEVLMIGLVVAVPLALVLCIIGIIVMIIIIARCKRTSKGSYEIREPEVIDLPQIVAAVMDDKLIAYRNIQRKDAIPKHNFSEHVRNLHSNKDSCFKSEFEKITKEPAVSNNIAQENRTKNRYVNIYGYDYCRVILNNPDGGDYVNAAYIDGYKKPQKYIATQGPTPSTTMDFWEMIWEQKASVVVMLTRLVEGTKTKCETYWNEEIDGQYQPGRNLKITTKSYRVMPGFEVRYFEVQKMGDEFGKSSPLKVKQFLYTAWPDHGVPQYSSSMVKFIMEQIRPEVQNSSAPIIVHCSAGAGRTGTLIAIDTTIDRLEEEGDINIFECVELMRARRTQMVQTSSQYIYIHDAINDFVTCGDTAIAAHELGPRTMGLHQVESGGLHTAFEEQFYTLEGTSPELCKADHDFAELPKVKPRNRYSGLHTYSDNFIETEDEENYVNATEIPGYYGQNHFIAAQAPMTNTVEDTWNVIREQDCKVVVVLTNFNEDGQEMCAPFWPTEAGVSMEVGFMKINLVHTLNYERYDVSEVSVTVQDSDIVTTAKVHHYKAWKKNGRPDVPSLLRLMGDVQRSHQGKKNPLLVMCDDGMSRTGVFITVMSEIDRVKVEGEVDIFHTVKAARKARPHMVSTVFDYELCHEILLNYLESFDTYANFKI